jgi:hypothetical protein
LQAGTDAVSWFVADDGLRLIRSGGIFFLTISQWKGDVRPFFIENKQKAGKSLIRRSSDIGKGGSPPMFLPARSFSISSDQSSLPILSVYFMVPRG